MYIIKKTKTGRKKPIIDSININGVSFGSKDKIYKIGGKPISNLIIYIDSLAEKTARKNARNSYKKIMLKIAGLLVESEDDGASLREALNEIERFRRILLNKYEKYLEDQEYNEMISKMLLLEKEAKMKFFEMSNIRMIENIRSSSRK